MKFSGVLFPRLNGPKGLCWIHSLKGLEALNLLGASFLVLYQALEHITLVWACWAEPSWVSYTCLA